ncbi:hypothetical protein BKH24_05370 [Actinomyces oris]|uniref:hypothetical protein n=1 Tax=Actinomyces TaxID=1654 RepID=UPI00094C6282|nr:hypothetical protein [Actinomyces oris]OLO60989.1 hypothetical protein BKH24_05370 [Actinomyces oris]
MDPTTEELLFMGTECETSGIEAFNTVRDMENLDAEAAVERTRAILTWLSSSNMIDLFLANPFTYEPDPRDGDPTGTALIRADRLWTVDGPDDRWLLYDATPWGRLMLENWWIARREKGSTN